MRRLVRVAVAVAILSLIVPGSGAQENPMVLEDPCSDTTLSFTGTPIIPFPQSVTWTDLAGLSIEESEEAFLFTVHYCLASRANEHGSPTHLDVYFEHNGQTYWLDLYSREQDSGAALYLFDFETRDQRLVGPLEPVVDDIERTYGAAIPRSMLLDASGAPPFPGRQLVIKYVESFTIQAYSDQAQVNDWDRMPDSGMAEASYDVQLGSIASGSARLVSANPSRASNGAAASYVYELIAANDGSKAESFRLDASNVAPAWNLELPISVLRLEAGAESIVPVIVTTPFGHRHGARESATISLVSLENPDSSASVNLSIVYHDVPQPAGHHDSLYLHSRKGPDTPVDDAAAVAADVFMNTLSEDSEDSLVNAYCSTPNLAAVACGWDILLSPGLKIGLDFDLARQGELVVSIGSTTPLMGATLTGQLRLASREAIVLAELGPASVDTGSPNEIQTIHLPISGTPESDFVPHDGSGNLILSLTIDVGRPVTYSSLETPYLAPGGYLSLPLNEYREPFTAQKDGKSSLTIVGEPQRKVNRGEAAVFEIHKDASLSDLMLSGVNTHWATLVDKDARTYVVVEVPEDAGALELADLILQASLPGGEKALTRIIVIADDSEDYPDDSSKAEQLLASAGRQANALASTSVVVALVAVMLGRRHGGRNA